MAMNRDKYRKIVGGITTGEPSTQLPEEAPIIPMESSAPETDLQPAGQGGVTPADSATPQMQPAVATRRFAMTGRPKRRKDDPEAKRTKIKVSLFLDEQVVNELYEWAYQDRVHANDIFNRALRDFRDREAKRRNAGKE